MRKKEMTSEDMLKLMKERRSIRAFKDEMISDETIQNLLEAARWCQSASNKQPWRFIIIKNKDLITKLTKLATYGSFIKQAPVVIAVVANKETAPKWYIHDTSIVAHQICLMAWSLGLGTCWIGSMDREKAAELLQLSAAEYLTTILPIGYPKTIPNPTPRKELKDLVSYM
jgi:nitroreductase